MIERKTVVDQLEAPRSGGTNVRLCLLLVDGDQELSSRNHRTHIPVGLDPDLQMAEVAAHLESMGEAPLSEEDLSKIRQHHNLVSGW